jgi:methyl-accepting chemotaxis protein
MHSGAERSRQHRPLSMEECLAFLNMDDDARRRLRALAPELRAHVVDALAQFYDRARITPQSDGTQIDDHLIASAKGKQALHWGQIAQGEFTSVYADSARAMGRSHARLGVEPYRHIASYALVLEHLVGEIVRARGPRLASGPRAIDDLAAALGVLVKAAMFDMIFSTAAYLEEATPETCAQLRELGRGDG